jgi:hypothetical protein
VVAMPGLAVLARRARCVSNEEESFRGPRRWQNYWLHRWLRFRFPELRAVVHGARVVVPVNGLRERDALRQGFALPLRWRPGQLVHDRLDYLRLNDRRRSHGLRFPRADHPCSVIEAPSPGPEHWR